MPSISVNGIILSNTYNNTTRFLGVSGTSVTSTISKSTAENDVIYHWNLEYYSSGKFKLYNPKSERYIRFYGGTYFDLFYLSSTGSELFVKYSSNGFSVMGENGSYYLYMSNDSRINGSEKTARYWNIYSLKASPSASGTTAGRNVIWSYPKPLTVSKSNPNDTQNLLSGFNNDDLSRIGQANNYSTLYLSHKNNLTDLQYVSGGTKTENTWVFLGDITTENN